MNVPIGYQEAPSVAILGTAADIGCDLNLLLQLSILGILLVGVKYGRKRTPGSVWKHLSIMGAASLLSVAGLLSVMAPAMLDFILNEPDFENMWAVTSLPHAALGALVAIMVVSLGWLFFTNNSPRNMNDWMRLLFTLWLGNISLGISLYLQMAGFI
jgi:hypothetical protein